MTNRGSFGKWRAAVVYLRGTAALSHTTRLYKNWQPDTRSYGALSLTVHGYSWHERPYSDGTKNMHPRAGFPRKVSQSSRREAENLLAKHGMLEIRLKIKVLVQYIEWYSK
jgi:hypothetical protein